MYIFNKNVNVHLSTLYIDISMYIDYNIIKKSNNGQIQDRGAPRRQLKGDNKMKYFQNCSTIEELKKEYRRLALINHPDNGGNPETMKTINAEYETVFNRLKDIHNKAAAEDTTGKKRKMNETAGEYMEVIQKIIAFSGIVIELCGSWVWVSGNTYEYKDAFKAAGFRWASKKKMWYWRSEADATTSRGKMSMQDIRQKYGSEILETEVKRVTA